MVLLHLAGAVALLLWATRMVRTGVERAYGDVLRSRLRAALRNPFTTLAAGILLAVALQSATATALLVGSFAGSGIVAGAAGLTAALGADVGSALVVRASQPEPVGAVAGLPVRRHRHLHVDRAARMAPGRPHLHRHRPAAPVAAADRRGLRAAARQPHAAGHRRLSGRRPGHRLPDRGGRHRTVPLERRRDPPASRRLPRAACCRLASAWSWCSAPISAVG